MQSNILSDHVYWTI